MIFHHWIPLIIIKYRNVSIAASEHCEAIVPEWNDEPTVEFLSGKVILEKSSAYKKFATMNLLK